MSDIAPLPTRFAPAERAPSDELARQVRHLQESASLRIALDAVPTIVMVLNRWRQLVYCNQALLDLLCLPDRRPIIGLRPGEILHCVHSAETEGGCGTAEFCRTCGAVRAILAAQVGRRQMEECRVMTAGNGSSEALDLRVWATPFELGGERYTVFSVADIRDEKRRAALEQTFFHDVLNTVGALRWTADMLAEEEPVPDVDLNSTLRLLIRRLSEEIAAQRDLVAAENHRLQACPDVIQSRPFLAEILDAFRSHSVAHGRALVLAPDMEDILFTSDPVLLGRVVGNMLRNALEATPSGGTVTTGCRTAGSSVELWVRNPGAMPREVQLQLFQRSFSTKGAGRGLGTYSMKLLSERYLHGRVFFTSSPDTGTEFTATYPLAWPSDS